MMDIANTLKGLLPKIGFTWNTLLRLFYSLCGWLVVGTLIPITGASGHTPVGARCAASSTGLTCHPRSRSAWNAGATAIPCFWRRSASA